MFSAAYSAANTSDVLGRESDFLSCLLGSEQHGWGVGASFDFLLPTRQRTMIGARSRRSNLSKLPTRQRTSRGNPSACLSISAAYSAANPTQFGDGLPVSFCCLLGSERHAHVPVAPREFLLPTRQRTQADPMRASLDFCCLLGSELDGRLAKARRHFLLPTRQRTGGRRPTSTLPISKLPTRQRTAYGFKSERNGFSKLPTRQRTNMRCCCCDNHISKLPTRQRTGHKEHSRPELFCCLLGSELTLAEKLSGVNFLLPTRQRTRAALARQFSISKLPTRQRTVPKSTQPFDSKEKQRPTH